ncbi:MAG: RimJ/RimL family protein N-acetyltransferase [Paraglaciecola sp.]|jgi:RimJ/RimL family protein N-acetyltransferase
MNINNTTRLTFRLMTEQDDELLFELDQDPAVMRYLNDGKPTSRANISNVFIPRILSYRNPDKGWGLWQVNINASQQFIGWILVRPMAFFSESPEWHNLELGWRFKQCSWGKGYAFEAANTIKNALICQGNITHLSAVALAENNPSIKLMKKLGMCYLKSYLHKDLLGEHEAVYYQTDV